MSSHDLKEETLEYDSVREGKRGVLSCHNSALTAKQNLCLSQRSDQTSNLIIFLQGGRGGAVGCDDEFPAVIRGVIT